jgi:hypothetical protein
MKEKYKWIIIDSEKKEISFTDWKNNNSRIVNSLNRRFDISEIVAIPLEGGTVIVVQRGGEKFNIAPLKK